MEDDGVQLEYYRELLQKLSAIEGQNRLLEFELETQTSVVNLLQETCQKHEKEVQEKQDNLKTFQQKCSQALESLKLQEETQRGLDVSLRNEAAAYHSIKNELHITVSTHKQLTAARNKTTFEKRLRINEILEESKIQGSTDLLSTDADACVSGDHQIGRSHRQIDREISVLLNSHPLLSALGDSDESRLRLIYSCMRDVQRLVAQGVLSYDAVAQFAGSRMPQIPKQKSSVDFLLYVVDHTVYKWKPKSEMNFTPQELALLRGAALKETMLANKKWYCEPEAVMYGTASLQRAVQEVSEMNPTP